MIEVGLCRTFWKLQGPPCCLDSQMKAQKGCTWLLYDLLAQSTVACYIVLPSDRLLHLHCITPLQMAVLLLPLCTPWSLLCNGWPIVPLAVDVARAGGFSWLAVLALPPRITDDSGGASRGALCQYTVHFISVLGMTLNCIHIFIVTGSFLYWCVMCQSAFLYTQLYLSTNFDHILFNNVSWH